MKEKYFTPEMEITEFDEDIITTSELEYANGTTVGDPDKNEGPMY